MMIRIEKTKTVGIFGMKGSGKTYFTRELIQAIPNNCVVLDTINAIKANNTRVYQVDLKDFEKQAILFSQILQKTKHNVGLDLSRLTKDEIVIFTEMVLKLTEFKNKYVFIDEAADYIPQTGDKSKELERLIRHGRNTGNTFVFNTQRPAYLTKNVLNLVDIAVFFRLVWNRDIDVVKELLNNLGKENTTKQIREITNLDVGEYKIYIFGKNI